MNRRGQGTLELAIASVMFVGVLVGGLWLSEVGFLSLKVQEAGAAATWNATGRQVHDFSRYNSPAALSRGFQDALSGPASAATVTQDRYEDFDASRDDGPGTARLFTRGSGLRVSCVAAPNQVQFNIPVTSPNWNGPVPASINARLRDWYQPQGGMACSASADATPWDMPRSFLDQGEGALFKEKLSDGQSLKLCAVGRAASGSCRGGLALMLGDWGFDGQPGDEIVKDAALPQSIKEQGRPRNWPYRNMVRELFELSGTRYDANGTSEGASSRFARKVGGILSLTGGAPADEKKFYMSYAGSEHDYVDMLELKDLSALPPACRTCHFNTTGSQTATANPRPNAANDWTQLRSPCFLGLGGCRVR